MPGRDAFCPRHYGYLPGTQGNMYLGPGKREAGGRKRCTRDGAQRTHMAAADRRLDRTLKLSRVVTQQECCLLVEWIIGIRILKPLC